MVQNVTIIYIIYVEELFFLIHSILLAIIVCGENHIYLLNIFCN